ncbi:MAG: methyltransferase domain-containing protein [Pseudomonadota bacterium]
MADERLTDAEDVHASVRRYYGETLSDSSDLQTSACATSAAPPPRLRALLANLHDETMARYYGCGLIAPERLSGAHVLDLGCGAGRDVYVLSQLVSEDGRVVGVDMTDAQLEAAERHREWHRAKSGHARSNVRFLKGYLEKLDALGLENGSFDVAVSNCVLNLAADKPAVLRGVRRLLKPGGEFYFSDVYADRPLSEAAAADPVLYGECLGGALVWSEFVALAQEAGFAAPRLVSAAPVTALTEDVARAVGETRFISATVRLFAAPADARAAAPASLTYQGGLDRLDDGPDDAFDFDLDTRFEQGAPKDVDAVTAALIAASRFAPLFTVAPTSALPPTFATRDAVAEAERAPAPEVGCGPSGCCG